MACCGKAKPRNPTATRAPYPSPRTAAPVAVRPIESAPVGTGSQQGTLLEYVGPTRMMVRGPTTGRIYRFSKPYTPVLIDDRDVPFLAGVPNLRPASASG
jgi:hypothetical protein